MNGPCFFCLVALLSAVFRVLSTKPADGKEERETFVGVFYEPDLGNGVHSHPHSTGQNSVMAALNGRVS